MKIKLALLFFLSALYSGVSISSIESCTNYNRAEKFLSSLLNKDEKNIIKYMGKSNVFLTNGKINKDIINFLYKSETNEEGWKSIVEIAALDKIDIKIIKQDAEVVTVIYYPKKFKSQVEDIHFLENEWMKKYFSCEFEVINGKWEFYQNVCFSETDGPFPPNY